MRQIILSAKRKGRMTGYFNSICEQIIQADDQQAHTPSHEQFSISMLQALHGKI